MIVCIAEKPSVAKEIAKVLGATTRRDGYFEGNGYQVTWAFGHLFHILEPQKMNPSWEKWNLSYLPMIPDSYAVELNADKGCKDQYKVIKQLYKKADRIVNCGDAGQEGELIQRRIMNYAEVKCPVDRLWISSLTEESIKDGFRHLRPQSDFDNLYKAGEARAEGDWLLGMNCTRLYSCKYGNHNVLSIGRVQTPTLAMIVGRDYEIENFRPKPYWVLSTRYRNVVFASDKGKMEDQTRANIFANSIKGHPFTVVSVEKKEENELPPQLYDLTSLQVECNKKFGLSAQQSLTIIQSLYEKKVSTYPRVDTKYLTDDIYSKCPDILRKLFSEKSLSLDGSLLPDLGHLKKSPKVFNNSKVTDHHAIIPTGESPSRAGITGMEGKVYELIAKRFVSVFLPPCRSAKTTVTGKVIDITFKTSGRTVIEQGWHRIYSGSGIESVKKEQILPAFERGEEGSHTPLLEKKMTTPPKRYTEATLLQSMETAGKMVDDEEMREAMKENGIGRPSSRAGIIENIIHKGYVTRVKKTNLVSTSLGRELINTIHFELLKSPALTGTWERKIRLIEHGRYDLLSFIKEIEEKLKEMIKGVSQDPRSSYGSVMDRDNDPLIGKPCPECGKGVIRKGPYGYYCSRYKDGCKWHKKK